MAGESGVSVAASSLYEPTAEQREYDFFPYGKLRLDFDDAAELIALYKEHRYEEALMMGLPNLYVPQPRWSLSSLLYLLAECRYQLTLKRAAIGSRDPETEPDFESALNYYQQARRYDRQSPFRPLADYRISLIYFHTGRWAEQLGELQDLMARTDDLPFLSELLLHVANTALQEAERSNNTGGYLEMAEQALTEYQRRFPKSPRYPQVEFLLGEIAYQRGDYREAYRRMQEAHQQILRRRMGQLIVSGDVYAHFSLAAHRQGKANLARPQTAEDREFVRNLSEKTRDPDVRLEYARILDAGGNRRQAMRQYKTVIRDLADRATPDQIFEAKLALTRYALADTLDTGIDPSIPYDEYRYPYRTLRELYRTTYDVRKRADLLREQARHLIAQGRDAEAIRLILPHLEPGRLPENVGRELRQAIWDVMPRVMRAAQAKGDYLEALRIYEAFGEYLDEHPRRNDILLDCARILLDSGLNEYARSAVERLLNMTPFASLSNSQQARLTAMSRELRLDPDNPEKFKRDARALLESDAPQPTNARVLRKLAETWAREGNRAYAAELYLRGTAYDELDWAERLEFYELAAEQYERQAIYKKVVEVAWQAIRFLEDEGVDYSQAPRQVRHFLLMLGGNFQKLGNYEQAIKAYEQFLTLWPEAPQASSARYEMATCYESQGKVQEALAEYARLQKESGDNSFWGNLAAKSAKHLEWSQSKPYLRDTEVPKP